MAKRRSNIAPANGRLADRRPETWLEPADYAAVKAAGTSPEKLAAIVVPDSRRDGSLYLRLSAGRHGGPDEMPGYILWLLAHGRRSAAIREWAHENAVDVGLATSYFNSQGRTA